MRLAAIVGGVALCLVCIWTARAQFALPESNPNPGPSAGGGRYPCYRTITASEVNVRSGGSEKFLATGSLRRGDRVVVLRESAKYQGWLEIKPPLGSFSWINERHIQRKGVYTAFVEAPAGEDVPILPGQLNDKTIPSQVHLRLKPGHLLVLLDDIPVTYDNEKWLPIGIVPGEVRYVPAGAVDGSPCEPLPELAENTSPDPRSLRGGGLTGSYQQPGNPIQFASQKTVYYSPQASVPGSQTHTSYRPSGGAWSDWGILRRTRYAHQGQPLYALENRGQVTRYAVTNPELTLEPYVGRQICLYGSQNAGGNYLLVQYVALP